MKLIDLEKINLDNSLIEIITDMINQPTIDAIPVEQLLSILSNSYNETTEDDYSQGFKDGWNACLKAIKKELDCWEKENE